LRERGVALREYLASRKARMARQEVVREEKKKVENRPPPRIEPVIRKVETSERAEKERQVRLFDVPTDSELPPLALLDDARPSVGGYSESALQGMSRLVEMKL